MDDNQRLEKYAQWLVAHKDQKGTPEFETVAKAYKTLRSEQLQNKPIEKEGGTPLSETIKAGLYGLQDALFLGADDEINALWKTALKKLKGEDASYSAQQQAESKAKQQMRAEHPWAYGTGEALGAFAPYGATGKVLKEAQTVHPMLGGALTGAAYGYNSTDGDIKTRTQNAAISGAIGAAFPPLLEAHAKVAGGLKKMLTPSSIPDDPHEREALLRFTQRLKEVGAKPTSNTVEALRKVRAGLNGNNQDLRQILEVLRKEHADNPVALSEINELRQSLGNQTSDISRSNLERVMKLAGDNKPLKDALDALATERDVAKRYLGNTNALFDDTLAGELGNTASRGYGRVGALKVGTKLPIVDMAFDLMLKGNRYNKALKALEKTKGIHPPSADIFRNQMATGVRKAKTQQALQKLGLSEVNPETLSEYASTLKKRMERSGIEPKGEPVQGFGLLGQLYTENGVDPDVFIKTAMDVARKEKIPLERLATLISESSSEEGKRLMAKVRAQLQEKGVWKVPEAVKESHKLRKQLLGIE